MMEKIEISKNVYLCRFEKALGHFVGLNVVLIENGNEALLVDTGYEDNFLEIKEDLDKRNIKITNVVVSHFHPDHTGGLSYLKDANIYGSEFAANSLSKYNKSIDHLLPNKVVFDKLVFNFGDHTLKLEKNIGHTKDGILITIDNKFMYVGDDMVYSHKGKALIPFCADQIVEEHILSIEKIYKNYIGKIIIPTHGKILENQDLIKKDLENRLTYLKYIQKNTDCTFDEFEKDTGIKFIGMKSHDYNTNKEVKKW